MYSNSFLIIRQFNFWHNFKINKSLNKYSKFENIKDMKYINKDSISVVFHSFFNNVNNQAKTNTNGI